MLLFWLILSGIITATVWGKQLSDVTNRWLSFVKRFLDQRYAQRYGQTVADQQFPPHPRERDLPQSKRSPSLVQLYVTLHGYFFRYCLGLARPIDEVNLSRREAWRLFVIGFLLRWGLGKITSERGEGL